jgi:O-antigen ligase/Flp pilus assembly protein TadD
VPSTSLAVDRYILAAAVVSTCVLFTAKAADPVNVIKLTALMLCALALAATAAYRAIRHRMVLLPTGPASWAALALLAGLVVAALVAPVTGTAILGAYGRNSGLLAYGSALVLFFAALRVLGRPHTKVLLGGVLLAGLFTATYGLLQKAGIDAVPWNNPFNPIIAALGNPNFASGYLGVAASVTAGGALWRGWSTPWRAASGVTALLCLLAGALSDSVQGPIAAGAGLFVVAVAWVLDLPSRRRRPLLIGLFTAAALALVTLVVGAVTKAGPLGAIFTDIGTQARAVYWRTSLDMFRERPLLGIGLDQYGSFWRRHRPPDSVELLGGSHFTDAAHSVPLQVLAQGGLLLGAVYLAFLVIVLVALVRGLLRLTGPDRMLLAAVGAGWAAYQVQSFVSIDQVPLIVLHFTLAGAVVAAAGAARLREIRLPGALQPVKAHPNDAKVRRRVAATAAPRRRPATGADLAVFSALGIALLVATWQAFVPLRANVALATGDKQLSRGDGSAALTAYERATDLVPSSSVYWLRQGVLFTQVEQPARARASFAEAAERDPFDVNALVEAGRTAEAAGDLAEARKLFQRAIEVDPLGPPTLTAAATFELRHSGAEEARRLLEEAVRVLPDEPSLWATLGDARAVVGAADPARQAYERALELDPSQQVAVEGLAKLDDTPA